LDHNETIRREFSKQAASFGKIGLTLSSQECLEWMVTMLPLRSDLRVLDVAAGTGHLGRAIAPLVREVIAIDITSEMLIKAREEAARADLSNIVFEEGDAASLPYEDASFDMVVSRLAVHHFEQPKVQLKEMARVCKSGHTVGIIDLLSPDDQSVNATYNRLEQLRDPSHTHALTKNQLVKTMGVSGIACQRIDARDIHVDFEQWITMTGANPQNKIAIRDELQEELRGGTRTGMRPYIKDGALKFIQTWCVAAGATASNKTDAAGTAKEK